MFYAGLSCRHWIGGAAALHLGATSTRPGAFCNAQRSNIPFSSRAELPRDDVKAHPQSKSPLTDQLYSYLLNHTREAPVLAALREETAGMHGAQVAELDCVASAGSQLLSVVQFIYRNKCVS
mmetsp:Transcript_32377/g.91742  ORF Transcript_32377/g.91742 Transcript_32377/m.91742 type:complete len:122 (+) Transcript_32377:96-461(+)